MCDPNATIRIKLYNVVFISLPPSLFFPIAGGSQLSDSLLVLRIERKTVDKIYGSVATQAYCHLQLADHFELPPSDWLAQVPGQHNSDCRFIFTTQKGSVVVGLVVGLVAVSI